MITQTSHELHQHHRHHTHYPNIGNYDQGLGREGMRQPIPKKELKLLKNGSL